MDDMTRLGDLILKHWTTHRPGVIEELEKTNQLQPALRQAQEQTGDLLYTLTVVQKMEYHAAWELAMREWAFLPPDPQQPEPGQPFPDHPAQTNLNQPRLKPPPLDRPSSGKPSPRQIPSHPAISE